MWLIIKGGYLSQKRQTPTPLTSDVTHKTHET